MEIKGINSDVLFPDMSLYEMEKEGDMALYLAHCDFYPYKSVIDNNKKSIDSVNEYYKIIAVEAAKIGDFYTQDWAMTSGTLQVCRVELLTYYSLLVVLVSLLEEPVNSLCRIYHSTRHLDKKLTDIKGRGLERAAKYLKDEVGVKGFTSVKLWEYITVIRDARNMIVHNGGRINKDFDKFDKFNICYSEEDNKIFLDYNEIMKMYDAILEFMDEAFRISPIT